MLSTLNKEKLPAISYAPFIMENNEIYIYISQTAEHYHNLIENPVCAAMIIEDEHEAKSIFARQRASFVADAKKIENDEDIYRLFLENHNAKMVERLRSMDFSFFKLILKKGRLVKGFGKAFDITYENGSPKLTPVGGNGPAHQGAIHSSN